jgi:hypothetical protein
VFEVLHGDMIESGTHCARADTTAVYGKLFLDWDCASHKGTRRRPLRDVISQKSDNINNKRGEASPPAWGKHRDLLILLAILLIAAIFRFTGVDFDSGTYQHLDER